MRFLRRFAPLALLSLAAVPAAAANATNTANTPETDLGGLIARLAKIGSCNSSSFSPDAKRLAVICNLSGLPQIWTVPVEGGWPTQVTNLDDQVTGVAWSPTADHVLAFSLAPGGGLNEQIYIVEPNGLSLQRITEGGKVNNRLHGWSPNGEYLLLGSNRANPGSIDSYLFHLGRGRLRLAAVNGGVGTLADVSEDGAWALIERVKSRGDSNVHLVGLRQRADVLLTPHEPPGTFRIPRFSPDGRTVYLLSDKDRDRVALARLRLQAEPGSREETAGRDEEEGEYEEEEEREGRREAPVSWKPGALEVIAQRDDADLGSFEITRDGKTAALLWNVAGESQLSFLDLETGKETPGPDLPGAIAGGLEFSRDGRLLAMSLSGANLPSDIWVLDRTSGGAPRQVTFSQHAGIDLEALVAPTLVRFKAHDGLDLTGWLYRPPGKAGETAGPVVISFHGGPEAQERPSFNATYQALLSRGISVLAPNVRGSSGFGKRFVNLDNGEKRVDSVKDIKACVDFLVGQKIADPKRIGIMGGSYGGYMTMAGLTEYPDLFAAGANLFGVVNFETFFSHTEGWMAAISKVEYGDPATQKEMLRSLSPLNKVDRIQAPTIVLHGANDTNVPVIEAEQTVESLKKRGIPVEYVLFPDEGHGFRKAPNRVRSTTAIVEWFERYLKPGTETGK